MRVQQKDLLGVFGAYGASSLLLFICLFICAGRATINPLAMSPSPCCRSWCAERNLGQLLCLLSGVKRTSGGGASMSAFDPKQTLATSDFHRSKPLQTSTGLRHCTSIIEDRAPCSV